MPKPRVVVADPIRAQLARQGLVFENRGQSRTPKGTLQTTYSVRPPRTNDRIVGHLGSMPIVVSPAQARARRTPGCSSRAPARRSPRRRSNATRDGPARPDDEPPLRLCARPGCGQPFEPKRRDSLYCSTPCRNAAKQRDYRSRHADVPAELLEQASLALDAIRKGADPYLTLSLVIWPPETADDARELLGAAA